VGSEESVLLAYDMASEILLASLIRSADEIMRHFQRVNSQR